MTTDYCPHCGADSAFVQCSCVSPRLKLTDDGRTVRIIGKRPSPEIMEQIKDRIGPDEAAVVVSADEVEEFLRDI